MSETLQKTVRLPSELVDYVESQEGRDFSKKLVALIVDVREGDARRKKHLEFYDKLIQERKDKLRELTDNLNQCILILNKLSNVYALSLED